MGDKNNKLKFINNITSINYPTHKALCVGYIFEG